MSQSPPGRDPLLAAEELLGDLAARAAAGQRADFESLVRAHPSLEPDLRALHGAGVDVDGALGAGRTDHEAELARVKSILSDLDAARDARDRYTLESEIGKGGMGVVYRVRDTKLDRPLAMKVILGQADVARTGKTPPIPARQLARFVNEAKITGQLDHPGIVPVHEVGVDQDGRAFFTMKLVKGITLAEVFDRRAANDPEWSMPRVLNVIQRVCEAMAFAHERGVIHRDLKPQNIMVGDFGEVYVMDWGLARRADEHEEAGDGHAALTTSASIDEQLSEELSLTRDGTVLGTPAYMSPEQARGQIAAMGPPSDVYALGAMLYQLIAGLPPYAKKGERVSGSKILARVVSSRPERIESRSTPPELIAICEKAMSYEPADRYPNVRELAADLQRFLGGRTVKALKTGTWAETKKWVQRNKPLSGALAVVLLLSVVGGVAFAWKASEAEARREEAELARAEALSEKRAAEDSEEETRFVAEFQSQMLSRLSPAEFGHTIMVELSKDLRRNLMRLGRNPEEIERADAALRELLLPGSPTEVAKGLLERAIFEPALMTIDREYSNRPLLAATLQVPLAKRLNDLGLLHLAEYAARAAVSVRTAILGSSHTETLRAVNALAQNLQAQGVLDESELLLREAHAAWKANCGNQYVETLQATNNLASVLRRQGNRKESEILFREALIGIRATFGNNDPETISSLSNLAGLLQDHGELPETEVLLEEALAICGAGQGNADPLALKVAANLARLYETQGRLSDAEALLKAALKSSRASLGDRDYITLACIANLAVLLKNAGKLSQAEPLYGEAVDGFRATLGSEHPETLTAINNYAGLLMAQRPARESEAEQLYRQVLVVRRAKFGDRDRSTIVSSNNLAGVLRRQMKLPEAEHLYRCALATCRAEFGDADPLTLKVVSNLAVLLQDRGELAEAEGSSQEALVGRRAASGNQNAGTLLSISNHAGLLQLEGKLREAEELYREVLSGRRATLGPAHYDTLLSTVKLAYVLREQKRLSEAAQLYKEALSGLRSSPVGGADIAYVAHALVSIYEELIAQGQSGSWEADLAELKKLLKK